MSKDIEILKEAFEVPNTTHQFNSCVSFLTKKFQESEDRTAFTIELRDTLIDSEKEIDAVVVDKYITKIVDTIKESESHDEMIGRLEAIVLNLMQK